MDSANGCDYSEAFLSGRNTDDIENSSVKELKIWFPDLPDLGSNPVGADFLGLYVFLS